MRFASASDLTALMRLINAAFAVERIVFDGNRLDERSTRDYLEKGKFLVLEDSASIAGCVYCELRGERGYLGLLAVDLSRQGTGLGRKLVAAAEDYFRGSGCKAVDLRTLSPRAPLPEFYKRLGYEEIGTAPFPPEKQAKVPGHFILMSKRLS
ncbi:MAG: GNAT family N-acetyltransferase [Candidatus Acidiferrum sp.]